MSIQTRSLIAVGLALIAGCGPPPLRPTTPPNTAAPTLTATPPSAPTRRAPLGAGYERDLRRRRLGIGRSALRQGDLHPARAHDRRRETLAAAAGPGG